jgi:hypothetical protein
MERIHIFGLIAGIAAVNGIFSPFLFPVVAFAPVWYPAWLGLDPSLVFLLASLAVSTTTLLLAGVPAALAERLRPAIVADNGDLWIWLVAAGLLSWRGFERMIGVLLG